MKRVNNQPSPACPPKGRYAGLDVGKLGPGEWRELTEEEVDGLRKLVKLR